jgi:hypothetical protein
MKELTTQEINLLFAYWDGELTQTERAAIEQRLSVDPGFKAEADALKETQNLLISLRRRKWKAEMQQWEKELPPVETPVSIWRQWWVWGLGMLLLVLAIVLWRGRPADEKNPPVSPANDLAKAYFEAPPLRGVTMGSPGDSLRKHAQSAYLNQDYKKAATLFGNYLATNPTDSTLSLYYKGVSELGAGQYNDACQTMRDAQKKYTNDPNAVRWYLALALTGASRNVEAIQVLDSLSQDLNYGERARELREKLKK